MAYKRGLPTFNKDIEPNIKKTVIQNPDGTTTYRDTWSSKTPARSSSYKAPASKQGTKTSYVAKRSTPAQTTYGERETTTVRPLKSVGILSQEITAPLPESIKKPVSKKEIKENTNRYQESVWLKNNPGKTVEDRVEERAKYVKEAQNKPREKYQSEGSLRSAKRSSRGKSINPCKTC